MIQKHDHDDKYRLEPESNELSKKKNYSTFKQNLVTFSI